jgi:hypothetical protein
MKTKTKTKPPKGRVRVYFDSTRRVFSARPLAGPNKGLVSWKGDRLTLSAVAFVVSAAGRERVRRTRKKSPHAFVEGDFQSPTAAASAAHRPVRYNPYVDDGFVLGDGSTVLVAAEVSMHVDAEGHPHVFALKPKVTRAPSR